ncbi:glycerophosphodiester phosphodiesterase family protein [Sutcliffiella rhizosphaerae]|uniref:GP-PDE domain-containing protein n=1 Tax=Sutcliffiella rhizosphaerae TaxID=2880967 RepID=A0ABN8A7R2_9BACI|nr:glycerophosphodiester phosphodiesterase family protein [Sutcliffiella rhizosphaerae]CAG9621181.1 hypothetical protein BACCIP111883_01953 [Sutcliffiella rhizosphaerae]
MKKLSCMILIVTLAFSLLNFHPTEKVLASQEVLINETFDDVTNGSLPENWVLIEGNGHVQDGKLVLLSPATSAPARVIAPIDGEIGNYKIEADITFESAVEDTRWASVMYRIQDPNNYYQFAIRRGASALNGIEFAKRVSNSWAVSQTNFFHQNFSFKQSYKLTIIVKDNRVQQFINGELVIDSASATEWTSGDVGFQASGTNVHFDNFKVTTYDEEMPPIENSGAFLPMEAETNIVNAPTIISKNEEIDLEDFSASVLLPVVNKSGQLYANEIPLIEQLQLMKNNKIPVLQIEQEGIEDLVIDALQETQTTDVQVVSSKPAITAALKELNPKIRAGLIYSKPSLNKNDLRNLTFEVHSNKSKVVLIPEKLLSKEIVHYLHNRMVAVWGIGGDSLKSSHALIHMGVDGIVTDYPEHSVDALGQYPENTIVQRPMVAAHRGVPSLAPENTMAGYRLSYELEADMIETDLQVSKDGHIIVMHDATVNRTTNGTGLVSDLTLEELKQLDAGIKFGEEFAGELVPTLREFLREFKGKDVVLLVELKAQGIEERVLQEIKEENMMDQVVIQNFDLPSMIKFNTLQPELPTGYLYSAGVPNTVEERLNNAKKMLDYGATHNVTLNASYGSVYEEFITYMRQRGMLSLHWTFRDEDPFADKLREGLIGPITDYMQWLTHSPIHIETPIKKVNLKTGKSRTIQAKAFLSYRTGETENIETELYTIDNNNIVSIDGNTIQALSPGTTQVFVKHTFTMLGVEWNLVSEPIEVNVSD